MELKVNQVVVNKRGDIGCVVGFNNRPSLIVFVKYCKHPSEFDENLKHKNDNYSIVKVYDVDESVTLKDVMKKDAPTVLLESLSPIYESK